MLHTDHRECSPGDHVDPDYFCPPTPIINGKECPVLDVIAFRVTAVNQTVKEAVNLYFMREELGKVWTLQKNPFSV